METSALSEDCVRSYLSKFSGGDVHLHKNEETGVATLSLDFPEKKNALSGFMMVELRKRVEELENWKTGKAIIFRGRNGNFCSGGDLDFARATGNVTGATSMSNWMQNTLTRLSKLPMISVCLVEGPTLGGGAELSVFCDFIVAADNVKYGFVHGKMGIIPAWGGATRLSRKIGQTKALDLLLTASVLSAEKCVEMRLAETVVPTSNALEKTQEWIFPRIQHHYSVIRAMKQVIYASGVDGVENSLVHEQNIFVPFWGGDINRDALSKQIKHVK